MGLGNLTSPTNFSLFIATEFREVAQGTDPEYEQFLADVWVGIVLTLMVLSCVCCMCSCLLYHKFQQWKRSVIEARQAAEMEGGFHPDLDTLPSYTIASGLPSYEEALEQLKKVKEMTKPRKSNNENNGATSAPRLSVHRLSVTELFQLYRSRSNSITSVNNGCTSNKSQL
ncbi:PREDICTED: uncharacterized protein LOC108569428 [Nicrophorus vespilloides]|uniref:Uncharacterized protein LOC108569428 n=1 Tax=Nicrophorus vespilloides TaxID=110193 RepID=A0ABM1NI14_NICVS|nr:PREDICTED: uncharacterized protein LOC108569428 [Nicrophorus vespilloides]